MLISIIIPVYNGAEVIEQCLDSIRDGRTEHELEIICVDDASRDDSAELICHKYIDVKFLQNQKNLGYAQTVNSGIEAARGEYLLMLNQDTEISADCIDVLADKLSSSSELGMVAPKLVNPDNSPQYSVREFPTHADIIYHHMGLHLMLADNPKYNHWKMKDFDFSLEQLIKQPAFSAVLLRRNLIEDIGLLDTGFPLFFNDVDYCRRTIAAGWKILYTPDTSVKHVHGQATSQQIVSSTYLSHEAFIRYLNKYYKGTRYLLPNFVCTILLIISAHFRVIFRLLKKKTTSKASIS